MNKGKKYDQKEAYNKNLSASARLHYLENARHDTDSAMRMESSKTEKKNLLQDMPIDKKASALKNLNKGYGSEVKSPMQMKGSFMSKHCQSGFQPAKQTPAKKKSCKY